MEFNANGDIEVFMYGKWTVLIYIFVARTTGILWIVWLNYLYGSVLCMLLQMGYFLELVINEYISRYSLIYQAKIGKKSTFQMVFYLIVFDIFYVESCMQRNLTRFRINYVTILFNFSV